MFTELISIGVSLVIIYIIGFLWMKNNIRSNKKLLPYNIILIVSLVIVQLVIIYSVIKILLNVLSIIFFFIVTLM